MATDDEPRHSAAQIAAALDRHPDFGVPGCHWRGLDEDASGIPGVRLYVQYRRHESGRWVLSRLLLDGEALTAEALRRVHVQALEDAENATEHEGRLAAADELPPLIRGGMSPEAFSRLVATHYNVWAAVVPHPANALAARWDVNPRTMHTWIREARLRGNLPAAHRGKSTRTTEP